MRPANGNLFLSDEARDELIIQRELANALRRSFEAVIAKFSLVDFNTCLAG